MNYRPIKATALSLAVALALSLTSLSGLAEDAKKPKQPRQHPGAAKEGGESHRQGHQDYRQLIFMAKGDAAAADVVKAPPSTRKSLKAKKSPL